MASIRGQYLGGESVVFDGVATVGDVMLRVARDEHRFASDVVVLPVGSGEVLEHGHTPPPDVCVVLKKEEDKLSAEECQTNVTLHAEAEDTTTVVRALAMLEEVSPDTRWPKNMLLEAAVDPAKEKTVRTLVRAGVDGSNALFRTSLDGNAAAVQRLVDAGTNVCSSAFVEASGHGRKEVVQILIEARADVNCVGMCCRFALWRASEQGHKEVVQILIEARADVNCVDIVGRSALLEASEHGRKEVVQILIEAQADVNCVGVDGCNALWLAVYYEHEEVVQILIEARAGVNCVDRRYGCSALCWASLDARKEVVQILIEERADVNCVDICGEGPLLRASRNGRKEVVQILIEARADVNGVDEDGESALLQSSSNGHQEVVQMLIDARADVNCVDEGGRSALSAASSNGYEEVVQILLDAGAAGPLCGQTPPAFAPLSAVLN